MKPETEHAEATNETEEESIGSSSAPTDAGAAPQAGQSPENLSDAEVLEDLFKGLDDETDPGSDDDLDPELLTGFGDAFETTDEETGALYESPDSQRIRYALTGAALLALVLALAVHWLSGRIADQDLRYESLLNRQEVLVRQIGTAMTGATAGSAESIRELSEDRSAFQSALSHLRRGIPAQGLRPPPEALNAPLGELESAWNGAGEVIQTLIDRESVRQADGQSTLEAQNQLLGAIENIRAAMLQVRQGRFISPMAGNVLILVGLALLVGLAVQVSREIRERAQAARDHEAAVVQRSQRREREFAAQMGQREVETRQANERNEEAILQLLDEISELADGNLAAHAQVTEDMTGAIADAVNFTIDALRELVAGINETAEEIGSTSQNARETTVTLNVASQKQATQITETTGSINSMATAFEQVASQAEESSQVAQSALESAKRGTASVRDTISGMDSIRETIQETAKRIKRLGESSQEIGDIVGLIDDIAEQTNILALNAAIQASMAGEAGQGFAVVADEVQRLAERAGQATKKIDSLVRTIRTDTNEAVASMEQSTTGVVSGARVAEAAGESLQAIENVSQRLARLVEGISGESRTQAAQAGNLAQSMSVIEAITAQTRTGTEQTAELVGNLATLAESLRTSVSGFRLPDAAPGDVATSPAPTDSQLAAG
jgi:twitching motility protein PilJ